MHRHLVTIEVSVERGADQRVQLDRLAFNQLGLKRLNAQAVQGRGAVEHDRVFADHFFQHVPDGGLFALNHALGLLDRARQALGVKARIDEGLKQLQRHFFRQAALMQLQLRTDHDDRTAGIVDALAEQVLTEPALLALEHVGERLERALIGSGNDPAAAAIVKQGVNGFLQHPLFVADNDIRRTQLHQALQAIIAVDHPAIQIIQV